MQKFYRRIFITLLAGLVFMTSCFFWSGFLTEEEPVPPVGSAPELSMAETPAAVTEPSAPETTPEPPLALEETGPPDGAVIDHGLPLGPVLTNGPWASEHFLMAEYACDCGGYCDGWPAAMDPVLLERVEALRRVLGRPVIITSGVRCPERNAEVGGIPGSWHLTGHAADLYCPGVPIGVVAAEARALGLGVIEYPAEQFDHVEIWQ